jgi:hypothetical protein
VGACSPTDFINEIYESLFWSDLGPFIRGVTSLYKVLKVFIEEWDASGDPRCSNSAKFRQSILLSARKPAQNSKQTKTKDGQKHFGSVFSY